MYWLNVLVSNFIYSFVLPFYLTDYFCLFSHLPIFIEAKSNTCLLSIFCVLWHQWSSVGLCKYACTKCSIKNVCGKGYLLSFVISLPHYHMKPWSQKWNKSLQTVFSAPGGGIIRSLARLPLLANLQCGIMHSMGV